MNESPRRQKRPALPVGFDDSRATDRRADPAAWKFSDEERAAVWRAIAERRDIRRFRPDPIPRELLQRLLGAAHQAPSVGLMQPWRFVVVERAETKAAMQSLVERERLIQAPHFDARARDFMDLKVEGIREAPVSICVACDRQPGREVLGRHTIQDTDLYSSCLAIENFWLAARAEGIGVGWVSLYRPDDVRELLGLPAWVVPVAWLCVGYPDERPSRPRLEEKGWGGRSDVRSVTFWERWERLGDKGTVPGSIPTAVGPRARGRPPPWWSSLARAVVPGEAHSAVRLRDESDRLVKPAGSLGALETSLERWAMATGGPPPERLRPGFVVFAADHGVVSNSVSLFPQRVSAQVAEAAARGETAIGVLAGAFDARLEIVDVGLKGPRRPGVRDLRVADGTADIANGAAMSPDQLRQAVEAGASVARELAADCDILVVGEIGIGNTTVAAALLSALTGRPADEVCGRGTGVGFEGLERKRSVVRAALARNNPRATNPLDCLEKVGGFEFAALAGAMLGSASRQRPILLDGFASGVAALAACRLTPPLRDYLFAGHRSAEPAHSIVLTELGLEPLLDLRMRLGEGSGAALALPLLEFAGRLHRRMARFEDVGVDSE